jgi:2-amino-4-hydroxy-6-hydroxymethyldihydropteridine diphosphokinase
MTPVGIALGSNLGDRRAELEAGFAFLATLSLDGSILRSLIIETAPVGCPPGSLAFLNAVAEIQVDPDVLGPHKLLARLQDFEISRGRQPVHAQNSPRPLDLDLLYYGDLLLHEPGLVVPHPRLTERRFVLEPLAEIRPGLVLPGQNRSVRELLVTGIRPEQA